MGIKGIIDDEEGEPIFNATIKTYQLINDDWQYIDHDITSSRLCEILKDNLDLFFVLDPHGDYYRLLVDGVYAIQVKKPGYESQTQYVHVHNQAHQIHAQRLDFTLQSISSRRFELRRMLKQFMNEV